MRTKGRLFGVGVGPGDPELMTLKGVGILKACDVVAVPRKESGRCTALKIAAGAVPEVTEKPVLALDMPMTRDRDAREKAYAAAAAALVSALAEGKDVAFITLGDPSVYSTFGYLRDRVARQGFEAVTVPGVTSFCAAAAVLGENLCEDGEPLHIFPGWAAEDASRGTRVYMKGGVRELRQALMDSEGLVLAAENVGMEDEKVYRSPEEIPEDAGYFTIIIEKEKGL